MNETARTCDVVIIGGGLAGMTLALQLKQADASLDIHVIERRALPHPDAAFKVGESTVEIAAHYFANVLGLRAHLDAEQIRKFGFRFFFSEGSDAIARTTELGVSQLFPTPSWQLDRGRFENFLSDKIVEAGVHLHTSATVKTVDLAEDNAPHVVTFEADGARHALQARWVVDASGRAGLLKRKLDLAKANDHDVNAAWWRVEGHVQPNDWSDDAAWLGRCNPPDRWRSTNHMCGPGYWLWLIPLSSGAHSIGIVADQSFHPLDTMNTHEKAMQWVRAHQPQLATTLEGPNYALLDFKFFKHFSYECKQVYSAQRWALTGEAGVFADPFYSPGSDFIAISNTYITDLIMRERAGEPIGARSAVYQQLLFSFYDNTMSLYRGQYGLFGNARVMPVKVIWDYTYYWGVLAPLYIAGRIADLNMLARLRPQLERAAQLNSAMQSLMRAWHEADDYGTPEDARLLDQYLIDWFHEMNRSLHDTLDDDAFAARIVGNVDLMAQLAGEVAAKIAETRPSVDVSGVTTLLAGTGSDTPMLSLDWYARAA